MVIRKPSLNTKTSYLWGNTVAALFSLGMQAFDMKTVDSYERLGYSLYPTASHHDFSCKKI